MLIKSEGTEQPCVLALADGTVFRGKAFGFCEHTEPVTAEVVFNTALSGYQEILTDPSYAGQMLTFTCPQIGNVGCNSEDYESDRVYARGLIIREQTKVTSNFRAQESLDTFLRRERILGISDIDTRALVKHLRDKGAQMGALQAGDKVSTSDLVEQARAAGSMEGKDYVKEVACKKIYQWDESVWQPGAGYQKVDRSSAPHLVVIDCGVKRNILRLLVSTGFKVSVVPAGTSEQEILALKPDALFLSNGPGDPATLEYVVNPLKALLGKLPIFGICLGHQMLSLALGAKTNKLKFGHRGGNHPVMDLQTRAVEITVQNHGFAVDPETLPKAYQVSHVNLNDQTVEGVTAPDLKAFAVQYHPEANPGPLDSNYLFKRFYDLVVK